MFATGYSMGGMFSNQLACDRASVIRASRRLRGEGPNGAPGGTSVSCSTASKALADIDTHGTKDGTQIGRGKPQKIRKNRRGRR